MARSNRLETGTPELETETIFLIDPTGELIPLTPERLGLREEDVGEEQLVNFYKKDPKEKPRVSLAIRKDDETIGARVQASIINGAIGGDMAAAFLFKIAGTIKHQLTTTFEVDGILIKRAGETVTPLDLIDVHVTDIASYHLDSGAADDTLCNDLTAAFVLCYAHLVCHLAGTVGSNDYIGHLVAKGMAIVRTSPMNGAKEAIRSTLLASKAFGAGLVNHPGFCGLLAAIDMFFLNFPNHALSKFRIATLQTYCKGYTILKDLTYMNEITGMERSEWSQGIFVEKISKQIQKLTGIAQYFKFHKSYFPYLSALRILTRSPFSVTVSPELHAFIHAVGTLKSHVRSYSARLVRCSQEELVFQNARVFALATTAPADQQKRCVERGADQKVLAEHEKVNQPTSINALDWRSFIETFDGREPPAAVIRAKQVLDAAGPHRTGTILEGLRSATNNSHALIELTMVSTPASQDGN